MNAYEATVADNGDVAGGNPPPQRLQGVAEDAGGLLNGEQMGKMWISQVVHSFSLCGCGPPTHRGSRCGQAGKRAQACAGRPGRAGGQRTTVSLLRPPCCPCCCCAPSRLTAGRPT